MRGTAIQSDPDICLSKYIKVKIHKRLILVSMQHNANCVCVEVKGTIQQLIHFLTPLHSLQSAVYTSYMAPESPVDQRGEGLLGSHHLEGVCFLSPVPFSNSTGL